MSSGLTKEQAMKILKKESENYRSFKHFISNHPQGYKIQKLVYRSKILDASEVFSLFGGKKVWNTKMWHTYLKANFQKYKNLNEFINKDPKGSGLNGKLTRSLSVKEDPLKRDLIRSLYWENKKLTKLTKKEWKVYLDKNHSKYNSLKHFLRFDDYGSQLEYDLYRSDNSKLGWIKENYWTQQSLSHELKVVHPAFDKVLKSKGINFEREVWLSKKSRVDRVLTTKDGIKILVELKSDLTNHSENDIDEQSSRYHNTAKRKYKKKYGQTYVVSPKGTYGLSFKEFLIDVKRFL